MLTELAAALFTSSAVYAGAAWRLAKERDTHQREVEALGSELTGTEKERDELRDLYESALDALGPLTEAAEAGHGIDAALDPARWVLAGGNYTGELRGARSALTQAMAELNARTSDEDATLILPALHHLADQVEPSPDGLDRIHARINQDTP